MPDARTPHKSVRLGNSGTTDRRGDAGRGRVHREEQHIVRRSDESVRRSPRAEQTNEHDAMLLAIGHPV